MAHKLTVEEHPWPAVLMHWTHAVSFISLIVTGILIHTAPLNVPMQTVRSIHFVMMFVFISTTVARIYWALVGWSANGGQTEMVRDYTHFGIEKSSRGLFWEYLKYYLFIRRTRPEVAKYNPLQKLTYTLLFPVGVLWMALTGFALWTNTAAAMSWFTNMSGGLDTVRVLHYLGMWAMTVFWLIHFYLVLVEEPGQMATMLFHTAPGGGDETTKSSGTTGTEPTGT